MPQINQLLQKERYRVVNSYETREAYNIYCAADQATNGDVLIAEIPLGAKKILTSAQQTEANLEFAQKTAKLKNVAGDTFLKVTDSFSEIGTHYLVFENFSGESLASHTANGSPVEFNRAIGWAEQLIEAVGTVHKIVPPLLHSEINPHNICVDERGQIRIFPPLLHLLSESDKNENLIAANIHYLPIELIWRNLDLASQKVIANSYDEKSEKFLKMPPDQRSDLYSLGAVLYQIFTGQKPVDALERSIELLEGKSDPLASPRDITHSLPGEISDFLLKSLALKRESRFDSAAIMRQFLRTALIKIKTREDVDSGTPLELFSTAATPVSGRSAVQTAAAASGFHPPTGAKASAPNTDFRAEHNPNAAFDENKKQLEKLKNQLREAEEKRMRAEQRAAEIEQMLLAEQKPISLPIAAESADADDQPSPATVESGRLIAAETESASAANVESDSAADDFKLMFADEQANRGSNRLLPIFGIAAVVLIGAAIFGFWYLNSSPAVRTSFAAEESAKPAQNPAPQTEPTTAAPPHEEVSEEKIPAPISAPSNVLPATAQTAAEKRKTVAPPVQKVKKPLTPAAPTVKKSVTVDDLINDN